MPSFFKPSLSLEPGSNLNLGLLELGSFTALLMSLEARCGLNTKEDSSGKNSVLSTIVRNNEHMAFSMGMLDDVVVHKPNNLIELAIPALVLPQCKKAAIDPPKLRSAMEYTTKLDISLRSCLHKHQLQRLSSWCSMEYQAREMHSR